MRTLKTLCLSLVLGLLFSVSAFASQISGKVVSIANGNSITVLTAEKTQEKIRLYGIDCPEKNQAWGTKARQFARSIVFQKDVTVETIDQDRYGRKIGVVYAGQRCLNTELLKNGYASVATNYCRKSFCRDWKGYEMNARQQKKGLWSDKASAPSFKASSNHSQAPAATSEVYSGNVRSGVFHREGCKYFHCHNCTEHFSSRDDAIKAGYRPCGVCHP